MSILWADSKGKGALLHSVHRQEGLGLTDSFWSCLPNWYETHSGSLWLKFLPSDGLLLIPGDLRGAQETSVPQLAVLKDDAWGCSFSSMFSVIVKGLLDFVSDVLQGCAMHTARSVFSGTVWVLCHRGMLPVDTESKEWDISSPNSLDVLLKSRMYLLRMYK